MDFSQVNWLNVGFAVSGVCVLAFAAAAFKRQWSVAALLVGLIHLPIVFVNSAAPFRGAFDPTYVGYNLGLIHADKGIEVAIFGLAVVAGGFASAYIAVLNQPGERNYFIVAFDSFLLLIWLPSTISTVIDRGLESFRVGIRRIPAVQRLPRHVVPDRHSAGTADHRYTVGMVWRAKAKI